MADCCPCCGYRRFGSRPIAEMEADNIRQWAETSRVTLARGNLLRPGDAASYTGPAHCPALDGWRPVVCFNSRAQIYQRRCPGRFHR